MKRFITVTALLLVLPAVLRAAEPTTLTPEQIKEVYHIPVEIAPGPFTADWKSFTPDKLKSEPDWWREAKIGVWFHGGPQSIRRNGDWYARFLYQQQGGRVPARSPRSIA